MGRWGSVAAGDPRPRDRERDGDGDGNATDGARASLGGKLGMESGFPVSSPGRGRGSRWTGTGAGAARRLWEWPNGSASETVRVRGALLGPGVGGWVQTSDCLGGGAVLVRRAPAGPGTRNKQTNKCVLVRVQTCWRRAGRVLTAGALTGRDGWV